MSEEYPDANARRQRTINELILPEGEYAYTRDKTSGVISVRCGPTVINMQGSEEPLLFNQTTKRFSLIDLQEAAQVNTIVPTGHYAVMNNPSETGDFPERGNKNTNQKLLIGQRVCIPGPTSFALWPRQNAKVIEGHQLRSNQYLIVNVYDEKAAKDNWRDAVMKRTSSEGEDASSDTEEIPENLSVGRQSIIRGKDFSFYIPPTGMEVVPNKDGLYVREALTLERLHYCILVDESGNKSYIRGPDVVFPLPTERFYENDKGERVFRPIELSGGIQGLHLKVIDSYIDQMGDHGPKDTEYIEGDELFITGDTTPIYFPTEEHSAIRYDGKTKHFATAIPAGDGRYVLNRQTGTIRMEKGGEEGTMCLPDPREEVFVRRVLTDTESEAMFPGNAESLAYNQQLRVIQAKAPTTRKGAVSEGDLSRGMKAARGSRGILEVGEASFADASIASSHSNAVMGGDEFSRAATYTEPRMVTIGHDKFSGVPKIDPWTGYCVMVIDPAGNRRVVHGPQRVLLGFSETLEVLALSTGKPKTTDHLFKTAYLQVAHNKVSDTFLVDTSDHVEVELKVAFRVNFEGDDSKKWFAVSNYVKLLTDHVRSVMKARVRALTIEQFWARPEEYVRDIILGPNVEGTRSGMVFEENAMRIYDVEIFEVTINDGLIHQLLHGAQREVVQTNIELARDQRRLEVIKRMEAILRETLQAKKDTEKYQSELEIQRIAWDVEVVLAGIASTIKSEGSRLEQQHATDAVRSTEAYTENVLVKARADNSLAIYRDKEAVRLDALVKETEARVQQLKAVGPGFSEALLALGNQETLQKVAQAMSVQQFVGGKDLVDVVKKVFDGTPLATLMEVVAKRAVLSSGNGESVSRV